MKKMTSLFASLLIVACPLLSFADEDSFSRGLIIAVDTRDHAACESTRTRVAGLTSANISNICAQDGRNPISVVVITKSISEFDYLADVVSEDTNQKRQTLASITHPTLGVMFFLPRSEHNNQYFRLLSQREKSNITIFRQADFGGMQERRDRVLTVSFMLRAAPHQNEVKDEKIVSSVGRRLVFSKGEIESPSRSQAKGIINAAAGIVDTINSALEKGTQENTSVTAFRPQCAPEPVCAESRGLTLGVSFIFRF
ncbi:MAG: hypothetical protein KUL82_00685 [Bdellovibrio sp.]|nr:hypothetical protein [Bdellovibrio sp.]